MTVDEKLTKRLKKDGLTIEDLTPEQLERAREEIKERMSLKRGDFLLDGFFTSMEYIGLAFQIKSDPNYRQTTK